MNQLYLYNTLILTMGNKEIDFDSDNFKVMLTTSGYTPNQNTHRYKSHVTNEITGDGYVAGGLELSDVIFNVSDGVGTFSASNVIWEALSTSNLRWAVLYDNTPAADANKPLLGYVDLNGDMTFINADFQIIWNSGGIFKITNLT